MSIIINDGVKISKTNTPTREGERINTLAEMGSVPTPYIGMRVYVENTKKEYIVTSLKEKETAGEVIPNAVIDTYVEVAYQKSVDELQSTLEDVEASLANNIAAEEERAQAAESELKNNIVSTRNEAKSDLEAVESNLAQAITTEIAKEQQRAESVEIALSEAIATIKSETEKRLAQQVKSLSAIMPVGKNYINPNGDLLHDRLVSGGSFVTIKGAIATDKLFLEKGVVYTTSGFTAYGSSLRMIAIMYFDENNNYIGRTNVGHLGASDEENPNYVSNFIYSPVDGTAYCRITLCGADGNIDFAKAQLEKGSFATSFEEFKGWRYAKDDSYAKEKTSELARNAIQMPRGKNYINKDDLYYGYSTSQGQYVKSPMSVQSNKLFLQPGVVYTIKGVDSFGSDIDQLFLILFDKNDNYIGRKQFDLKEGRLCTFTYPQTRAAYSRILLYNYSQGQKQATDIEIVQLEKGDTATEFEAYAGTDYIAYGNTSNIGNILLTGASFADKNFNQWFEIMCMELGVRGYNKGLSGSSIHDTAQKMHDGTLYTKAELEDFEVLMIMHVHNNNVANTTGIMADYKNYTFPAAGNLSHAQAFDYVLKKYAADCYTLKNDTTSKWYGQKMGKPCKVVCLTHWHDSRSIYNEAIRTLRDKWGFTLVELDKNIGFSKNQPHPITAEQTSIMYAVDTEVIDGVTYGWHPSREFVNNEPPIIQKRIAEIVKKALL